MRRPRDNQRSRVYSWENAVTRGALWAGTMKTVDECAAFVKPIWRAERGRYGRAKVEMPLLQPSSWGQRSALAHADHRITLPRWARNPWVLMHEMAHRLTPHDEAHGPRFVGVLIGLASRHLGYDADVLMAKADEMGVRYHVQSIGAVPIVTLSARLKRLITEQGPLSEMWAAAELDVSYLQVRGAMLQLIRRGEARWYRKKITLTNPETSDEPR